MDQERVSVVVLKFGCIGMSPLLDVMLDERASRKDISVVVLGSGAKLDPDSCNSVVEQALAGKPGLVLMVSPNAALPGPTEAREKMAAAGIWTISLSDSPSKKAFYTKDAEGKPQPAQLNRQGFIIITCDSMIGARAEFLDPTEMTLFNADIIKVLSGTGVIRLVQRELDGVITALRRRVEPVLPAVTISAEDAIEAAAYVNPYAAAKAYAAYKIAESVSALTTRGCFRETEMDRFIPLVAAGHELMRTAALLCDEARELEKASDSVMRTPHSSGGEIRRKTRLLEKPA